VPPAVIFPVRLVAALFFATTHRLFADTATPSEALRMSESIALNRWVTSQVASRKYGLGRSKLYLAGLKGEVRSDVQDGCPPRWWEPDLAKLAGKRRARATA
jgi:hypothetical protein